MEHFEVLLQGQRCSGQLLLLRLDVLGKTCRRVDKQQLLASFKTGQQSLVVFGVFSYPGVAVVDVDGCHVLVGKVREDHEPLGQEIRLEAVTGTHVGEIHYDLVVFGIVRLEG